MSISDLDAEQLVGATWMFSVLEVLSASVSGIWKPDVSNCTSGMFALSLSKDAEEVVVATCISSVLEVAFKSGPAILKPDVSHCT